MTLKHSSTWAFRARSVSCGATRHFTASCTPAHACQSALCPVSGPMSTRPPVGYLSCLASSDSVRSHQTIGAAIDSWRFSNAAGTASEFLARVGRGTLKLQHCSAQCLPPLPPPTSGTSGTREGLWVLGQRALVVVPGARILSLQTLNTYTPERVSQSRRSSLGVGFPI